MAEARRNLTLTDRRLKTRGIASLAAIIMQDQKAGDINHKDVKNRITAVLTEDKDFYKEQAETAKERAGELYQDLLDKREELWYAIFGPCGSFFREQND